MMKQKLLLLLLAVLLPLGAWADDSGTCGENLTWTYVEATQTLTISGTGRMTYYNAGLLTPWYNYRSKIKTVVIESGVTSIGYGAFGGCSGLTSVTIPNSVTSIGSSAFSGCSGLTSITIPNSVTSIESSAFGSCSGLTSVTIPNSVTSIGERAFTGTGWYNAQPDGILYLDNWLIDYKGAKPTGDLIIIDGTKGIAEWAFYGCRGLTSVTIPNSVTSIGSTAFSGCI